MKDWKTILIPPTTPIIDAIRIIDASALQLSMVVDEDRRLLGTVTDGDIRRAILRNISLDTTVDEIMYTSPTVASVYENNDEILSLMRETDLRLIPIVDYTGRVMGLKSLMDIVRPQPKKNLVVIMAGGLGSRLRPLTNDCPKPLLKVGGKPILEIIIENFVEHGFNRFFLSVNYKANMIENYFGDGSRWNIEIQYLRENEQLGTAGALSLLPETPEEAVLVMNGDLLTNVNFQNLIDFHYEYQGLATMAVREYDFQVPYGVVQVQDNYLVSLDEKPIHRFFVNAGIYVLEPDILAFIPKEQFFNMTELFERLLDNNMKTTTFPIREYWLDIGRISDIDQANGDFCKFINEKGEK